MNRHSIQFRLSLKYGIPAGVSMAAILLIFQILGGDQGPFVKLIRYFPLIILLAIAYSLFSSWLQSDKIFVKGLSLGIKLSAVAAIVLSIANLTLYLIAPALTFNAFAVEPATLGQAIIVSAIHFMETFVFGGLISFVILQTIKKPVQL